MTTYSSILSGESLTQKSLVGCSLWGHKESDTTERLTPLHSGTNTVFFQPFHLLPHYPNPFVKSLFYFPVLGLFKGVTSWRTLLNNNSSQLSETSEFRKCVSYNALSSPGSQGQPCQNLSSHFPDFWSLLCCEQPQPTGSVRCGPPTQPSPQVPDPSFSLLQFLTGLCHFRVKSLT